MGDTTSKQISKQLVVLTTYILLKQHREITRVMNYLCAMQLDAISPKYAQKRSGNNKDKLLPYLLRNAGLFEW